MTAGEGALSLRVVLCSLLPMLAETLYRTVLLLRTEFLILFELFKVGRLLGLGCFVL